MTTTRERHASTPMSTPTSTPMSTTASTPLEGASAADRLGDLAAEVFPDGLPVGVVLWDGSRLGPRRPGGDGSAQPTSEPTTEPTSEPTSEPTTEPTTVRLTSADALRRLLWRPGELGLAQAYVTGELEVDGDLLDGLRHLWRVAASGARRPSRPSVRTTARTAFDLGLLGPPPPPPDSQASLRGRLHSLRRDRAAIAHHYDLSNDFYELLLDPHRAYSCAYWRSDDPSYTLADAQRDKLDLVCRKLGLAPGKRLLDIGCGWGSLALYAAQHYGADVTAVTLSEEQRRAVSDRVARAGLDGSVRVRLQDYRDVNDPPFDAVSAIEMGEHVGRRNYPLFLRRVHDLLVPRGRFLVQQMSRRSHHGGGPFIEAFIAPDMDMRPVGDTVSRIEDAGLEVRDVHALREHYVRTVRAWYSTFEERQDEVVRLVGEEGARVWRLYLVGGALAFEQGRMGVDQILAVRRDQFGDSGVPAVREW